MPPKHKVGKLAYRMIAKRDNDTVKAERESRSVIVAKAKIWASEGWQVTIIDTEGKVYQSADFQKLAA
jgi:hypothetical protein